MTIPLAACGEHERNVYEFNIGSSIRSGGGCCGRSIFSALFGGDNFWQAAGKGAAIAAGIGILDWIFSPQQKFDGWFSSTGNWSSGFDFSGWSSGLDFSGWGANLGGWFGGYDQVLAASPLGFAFAGLEQTKKENEAIQKSATELVDSFISTNSDLNIEKDSDLYKSLLEKAIQCKKDDTNITDTDLKATLECYAKGHFFEEKIATLAPEDGTNVEAVTIENVKNGDTTSIKQGFTETALHQNTLYDINNDGTITVNEYVQTKVEKYSDDIDKEDLAEFKKVVKMEFNLIDRNNDGYISTAEMAGYLKTFATINDAEGECTASDITHAEYQATNTIIQEIIEKEGEDDPEYSDAVKNFYKKHKANVEEMEGK